MPQPCSQSPPLCLATSHPSLPPWCGEASAKHKGMSDKSRLVQEGRRGSGVESAAPADPSLHLVPLEHPPSWGPAAQGLLLFLHRLQGAGSDPTGSSATRRGKGAPAKVGRLRGSRVPSAGVLPHLRPPELLFQLYPCPQPGMGLPPDPPQVPAPALRFSFSNVKFPPLPLERRWRCLCSARRGFLPLFCPAVSHPLSVLGTYTLAAAGKPAPPAASRNALGDG
ncbi:hypothetical protein P7K49_031080 [Saguinus oedipus]|uniref:Uncharacterized protein n=1 Tax=Saguinus oedipus TaxID=9490 RepID=A0ABQ9U452_SAGOE|nr:hypothetical protein P7K49_031080 [Saguinus oedipus]